MVFMRSLPCLTSEEYPDNGYYVKTRIQYGHNRCDEKTVVYPPDYFSCSYHQSDGRLNFNPVTEKRIHMFSCWDKEDDI